MPLDIKKILKFINDNPELAAINFCKIFAEDLVSIRESKKLSIEEAASKLMVSEYALLQMENADDNIPVVDYLKLILKYREVYESSGV